MGFEDCWVCNPSGVKLASKGGRQHFHGQSRYASLDDTRPLRLVLVHHRQRKLGEGDSSINGSNVARGETIMNSGYQSSRGRLALNPQSHRTSEDCVDDELRVCVCG